jgi:hypothetical protein
VFGNAVEVTLVNDEVFLNLLAVNDRRKLFTVGQVLENGLKVHSV